MSSRQFLSTTGDVALQLRRLTAASGDSFPPLKSAAGGALHIAEIKFDSNKTEWRQFGEYVRDATASVVQSLAEVDPSRGDPRSKLEKLNTTPDETAKTIEKFMRDPELIVGMRRRVNDDISLFQACILQLAFEFSACAGTALRISVPATLVMMAFVVQAGIRTTLIGDASARFPALEDGDFRMPATASSRPSEAVGLLLAAGLHVFEHATLMYPALDDVEGPANAPSLKHSGHNRPFTRLHCNNHSLPGLQLLQSPSMLLSRTKKSPSMKSYGTLRTPMFVVNEDPMSSLWSMREHQAERVVKRDEESKAKHAQTIAKAEGNIDKFYEEYNAKKERQIRENKENEVNTVANLNHPLSAGTTWSRICNLIDIKDSQSKAVAAVARPRPLSGAFTGEAGGQGARSCWTLEGTQIGYIDVFVIVIVAAYGPRDLGCLNTWAAEMLFDQRQYFGTEHSSLEVITLAQPGMLIGLRIANGKGIHRTTMSARRFLSTTGDVALQLLRLTAASADAFPPLKSAAGGALHIAEIVKKFHSNKKEWREFGDYVRDATASVVQSLTEVDPSRGDPRSKLEKLNT
ncbi:hypothetical protein FRC06_007227, partial [Ceratobasidium sp. 370]